MEDLLINLAAVLCGGCVILAYLAPWGTPSV